MQVNCKCLASLFHRPIDVASGDIFFQLFAFVVRLTPFSHAEQNLGSPLFEVHFEWNEGESFFFRLSRELQNLALMQKKLPFAFGLVVQVLATIKVGGNLGIDQKYLATNDRGERFAETQLSVAKALDFAASELDSAL